MGMKIKNLIALGAKNNDSHLKKQAIVIFYTPKYRKCNNSNSKNDSRPSTGASAIPQSVDFRAFAVNVKTIAPTQKLYQSGHAIWWRIAAWSVNTFIEANDFTGKSYSVLYFFKFRVRRK